MRTTTRHSAKRTGTRRLALVALATAAALLAGSVQRASAAPAATAQATGGCWLQVVNDWLDNSQVDGTYAIPCYTQAIQHLNAYPDVRQYSSAMDDIHRALLAAIHEERGNGPGAGPPDTGGGQGTPSGPGGGGTPPSTGGGSGNSNPITNFFHSIGPGNAQSVPLPLLVLGGLAVLLLLAAAGTWVVRRRQARVERMTPAPAPAPQTRP